MSAQCSQHHTFHTLKSQNINCWYFSSLQLYKLATMEMFVSLEEPQAVKALWRYAMVEHGEQCVKMAGM